MMIIKLISKLVHTINARRLVTYAAAGLLSIVLWTMYENRSTIFVALLPPTTSVNTVGLTFSVSKESENVMKETVLADSSIIGIAVSSADLRLNESRWLFFTGDNATLVGVNTASRRINDSRLPLFSSLEENNVEIIKLINGQFSCVKFKNTMLFSLYPQLENVVRTVCRVSIPSYYGYFSGYVSVYFSEELNEEKKRKYELAFNSLATTIYFRDVIPTQKKIDTSTPIRP